MSQREWDGALLDLVGRFEIAKRWQESLCAGRKAGTEEVDTSQSFVHAILEEGPLMGERNFNVRLNIPTEGASKGLHVCVLNESAEN